MTHAVAERQMLLNPGLDLTLRPMRYPVFYEMYKAAIRNTWTVEEVDFSSDLVDLRARLLPAEKHIVHRYGDTENVSLKLPPSLKLRRTRRRTNYKTWPHIPYRYTRKIE